MGVGYYTDPDDFCEEHPDVVILSTSILSLEQVGRGSVARLVSNSIPLTFVSSTHMAILSTSILSGFSRQLQNASVSVGFLLVVGALVAVGSVRPDQSSCCVCCRCCQSCPSCASSAARCSWTC